jgi:hypothetical protein
MPLTGSDKAFFLIPKVIGKLLYYARAVDSTLNVALSSLASEQSKPTIATQNGSTSCSTIAPRIPLPASRIMPPTCSYRSILTPDTTMKAKAAAKPEVISFLAQPPMAPYSIPPTSSNMSHPPPPTAKLGPPSQNCKEAIPIRLTLEDMGFPQPATPVLLDNTTALGFIHETIKQRRTKAVDMRYYWLRDREAQQQFQFQWETAKNNLADYFTKHHLPQHQQDVRHHYVALSLAQLSPSTISSGHIDQHADSKLLRHN